MSYRLPYCVEIDGKEYKIRDKCNYEVILDVIETLNDNELTEQEKMQGALFIFFEDGELEKITNFEEAVRQMFIIINNGEEEEETEQTKPKVMDWKHDFKLIAPAISHILGYDVRDPEEYTHWWTWLGGYMEIGEGTFQTVVSIRSKKAKGKKLEKHELEFYRENRKMIDLPQKLTKEEQDFLDSDW